MVKKNVAGPRNGKKTARTERRRQQTREEILEAARGVLFRDGVSNLTVESVARELELTKPAIYYYFQSKEALLSELVLHEFAAHARAISSAVEATATSSDAIEQLIRTFVAYYRDRMDSFRLTFLQLQLSGASAFGLGAEQLERLRPLNDLLYGGVEKRIAEEHARGELAEDVHPRRLAVAAWTAALGLMTFQGIAASADDPLLHDVDDLTDELCRTFRAVVRKR